MVIQKAEIRDVSALKAMYGKLYTDAYVRYWFEYAFKPFSTYVVRKDAVAEATLTAQRHGLWLKGKKIGYTMFSGFYAMKELRESGAYDTILDEVLEEISYNDLFVLSKADKSELYARHDFSPVYTRKTYVLSRPQIKVYPNMGITDQYQDSELLSLYQQYTSHFDGYMHRDKDCYQQKRIYWQMMGYRTVVYHDKKGIAQGYLVYDASEYPIKIKELIYLNSVALLKLLSYTLNIKDSVLLSLSEAENIVKLIPTAICSSKDSLWGKITDYELFNRLYNCSVSSVEEALSLSGRPLFFNEEY